MDVLKAEIAHKRKIFFADCFVVTCALVYVVPLIGFVILKNAKGEEGWAIFIFIFTSMGITIFNGIFGFPLILLDYCDNKYKRKVIISYLIGVIIPVLLLIWIQAAYNTFRF